MFQRKCAVCPAHRVGGLQHERKLTCACLRWRSWQHFLDIMHSCKAARGSAASN